MNLLYCAACQWQPAVAGGLCETCSPDRPNPASEPPSDWFYVGLEEQRVREIARIGQALKEKAMNCEICERRPAGANGRCRLCAYQSRINATSTERPSGLLDQSVSILAELIGVVVALEDRINALEADQKRPGPVCAAESRPPDNPKGPGGKCEIASEGCFTQRACKALSLAAAEAHRFRCERIGTEHILLGLVKEGLGVAANVLRACGLDRDALAVRVSTGCAVGGPTPYVERLLSPTPYAERLLEAAKREAWQLGDKYVGTEHLLLGLLCSPENRACQILTKSGIALKNVRAETLRLLGKPDPCDSHCCEDTQPTMGDAKTEEPGALKRAEDVPAGVDDELDFWTRNLGPALCAWPEAYRKGFLCLLRDGNNHCKELADRLVCSPDYNPIVKARAAYARAFRAAPDFRESYVDNIAMLLHDRYDIGRALRNAIADDVLRLIFGSFENTDEHDAF